MPHDRQCFPCCSHPRVPSTLAAANTPAGPAGALVAHFPASASLSPTYRRIGSRRPGFAYSAHALIRVCESAWSLDHPRCDPLYRSCFMNEMSLPPSSASDCQRRVSRQFAGRDSHPLTHGAFPSASPYVVRRTFVAMPILTSSSWFHRAERATPVNVMVARDDDYSATVGINRLRPDYVRRSSCTVIPAFYVAGSG